MKSKYSILITQGNCATVLSTIYSLKQIFDCELIITGTNPLLSHFCSRYYELNKGDTDYEKKMREICADHNVRLIIPHSMEERIMLLDLDLSAKILSPSKKSIIDANDKLSFFRLCEQSNIPVPKYQVAETSRELYDACHNLGYPKKDVIVKPVTSRGSRGFRIVTKKVNYKALFFEQRGESYKIRLTSLIKILGHRFPPLIVSEYLSGQEYTVDCLRQDGMEVYIPRLREKVEAGLSTVGKTENNKLLVNYSRKLAKALDLKTVFGFQFKEDASGSPFILECNPRIQGTMIVSTLAGQNIVGCCARMLLGEKFSLGSPEWNKRFYRLPALLFVGKEKRLFTPLTNKNVE
jgi:carbamoyl-phosphate synthase large subunit